MIARAELKERARKRFTGRNYMACIAVVVIDGLIALAIPLISAQMPMERLLELSLFQTLLFVMITFLTNLLLAPILIEQDFFFLRIYREEEATVGSFFSGLLVDVGRKLVATLWQWLFTALWALPFVAASVAIFFFVPFTSTGVIILTTVVVIALEVLFFTRVLRYSLMSFIVRDCPELSARETLRRSIAMMAGHRWELVKLQLSFLGWVLMGMLLFGIPMVLYVVPYMSATMAGFYDELKKDAQTLEYGQTRAKLVQATDGNSGDQLQ